MKTNKDVHNAEFSAEDLQLINEIQKQIDKTDSTQLVCNYEIGKLIEEAYGAKKNYGSGQIERIAEQVGKAPSTLYGYLGTAQDYTRSDIQILAYEKFATPYKLLKAYKKLGPDEIMRVYDEVDSLNEFKAKLKARWLELKAQKNNEHPEPTVNPPQAGEGDGDDEKGPDDTATPDNENSPRGENSPLSEEDPSSAPTTPPGEKLPQDQNENDNPDSEDNPSAPEEPSTPDADETPTPDDAPELTPDGEDLQEDGSPQAPNYGDIKQMAGATVEIAQPADPNSGTPVDMLNANLDEDPTGTDDGMVAIAKSRLAELEELEQENKDLRLKVDLLDIENKELKKTIATLSEELDAQGSEDELEYA